MQLDHTGIVIRERSMFEVLDLSLCVLRTHAKSLVLLFLLGVLPMALLNHWVLSGNPNLYEEGEWHAWFTWWIVCLVIVEIPLVTAPATLYLGQVLFLEKPGVRKIVQDFVASAWQVTLLQGIPWLVVMAVLISNDGVMLAIFILIVIPLVLFRMGYRPYLNEIILLERNPIRSRDKTRISTRRRSKSFHSWNSGSLFSRSLAAVTLGCFMAALLVWAIFIVRFWLTGTDEFGRTTYMLILQVSLWLPACFFSVVRFLSYLDLRIRREGWEIELRMRAEAARLSKELI